MTFSPFVYSLRTIIVWAAAFSLCALPIIVAVDFGGILRWTHLMIGFAVLGITLASLAAFWDQENRGKLRQHVLLLPMAVWFLFSLFQTISLPSGIVGLLSGASYEAYTQWLQPIVPADELPSWFAISVSPLDSGHAVTMLALVASVVFASTMVFCTRKRITLLLSVCAVGVTLHVAYAGMRLVFPGTDLFDQVQDAAGASFGTFINRNNAALFMNLGLGCSLGLLSWRLSALTGQDVDDDQFEFNDLVALIGDRDSMIGIICSVFCIGGLLICGSRGGIVAILFGSLLAFGWVRQKRGFATLPVMAVVVGISAAILLVPLQLDMKSIERFEFFNSEARTFASDGRLMIWPEGLQAGVAYLPSGSGLSTFAYSYLPFQTGELKAWAQHADNLWLELFVEQGLFGIAIVVWMVYLVVRSLNLLRDSPDPIDQGLRTAGWYIIGAVVCSQIFDFGLILPANFLLLAIIFPAIIARRVSVTTGVIVDSSLADDDYVSEEDYLSDDDYLRDGQPRGQSLAERQRHTNRHESNRHKGRAPTTRKSIFASRRRYPVFAAIAAVAIVSPALAIPKLKRSAEIETLVRSAKFQLDGARTDPQKLKQFSSKLALLMDDPPEPSLANILGDYQYAEGRLTEVLEKRPETAEDVERLFDETKPVERKHQGLQLSPTVTQRYTDAMDCYNESLVSRPLGVNARAGKLYLGFLQDNPDQSRATINQLFTLHRNNPSTLLLLGEYAANRNQFDQAAKLWETASLEQSNMTVKAISLSQRYDQIPLASVIPHQPKAVRIAAQKLLLSDDQQAIDFLSHAYDEVACDQCDSLESKATCLSLRGDIAYKLQRYDDAFQQYAAAIDCNPSNASIRLKLVQKLREQGHYAKARRAAQMGRDAIPAEKRFSSLIKAIADDEVRQADN